VLQTILRPHGHLFKVTLKGGTATQYENGIFWVSATLMLLTFIGMTINNIPDIRIVSQEALVPLVAFWCAINIVVLFLVCMMCLQAPIRRGEERFTLNEPVTLVDKAGLIIPLAIHDLPVRREFRSSLISCRGRARRCSDVIGGGDDQRHGGPNATTFLGVH
jgi:cellulose synthase (UDP-forming)